MKIGIAAICAAALLGTALTACATDRTRPSYSVEYARDDSAANGPMLEALGAEKVAALAEGRGRLLVRGASLGVAAREPEAAAAEAERIAAAAGGYVQHANRSREHGVSLLLRVPAERLDATLDRLAELGDEQHRSLSADDVTEQVADVETRLRNARALRERLQELLARADDVEDVLAVEKELNRIQNEVESMEAHLDRLAKDVALSTLHLEIEQRRILGPLGYAAEGLWWTISKLFVIR